MAMPSVNLLSLLLLCACVSTQADDEVALLAFKAAAIAGSTDGGDPLASWNGSGGGAGGFCSWEGVRCGRRHRRVVALSLPSYGLTGTLSPAIGNLTFMRELNLSSNWFRGDIPESIGHLVRLQTLDLSVNTFSGALPANLSSCASLMILSLTGSIPGSLANMTSLYLLNLNANQLDGLILHELGSIGGLQYLFLSENNLSGVLPHALYNLSMLKQFVVLGNHLAGTIPADIGDRFPNMEVLTFSANQFRGAIPPSVSNISTLRNLELASNSFSKHVPPTLGRSQGLEKLYLGDNKLQANDREGWEFIASLANCSQLQILSLDNNSFTGKLPNSITNLSTTLQYLNLGDMMISGFIPSNIGNFLSGLVPSSLGNLTHLNELFAYYGNLEGPIPASLGNLKNMFILDLSTNRLNGSIPSEILKLPTLSYYLDLSYNSLSGPLPTEVGTLANLNQLILSGNKLSGNIPNSIQNCKLLERLLLDHNSFEGSIPQSLANLKGLALLNLTMNKLSGRIPDALSSIHGLEQLYLAHNNLSGLIPSSLQNLTSLSMLDLSFNNLQGEVPKGGVFANATYMSIYGNDELCGGAPQFHLAPCFMTLLEKKKRKLSKSLMVALTLISVLVFLVLVVVLTQLIHKKLKKRQGNQLIPTIGEQYERVSYHALSNGTHEFSEDNLLGQGSYGTVYKCTLHDHDTTVAVKVFNTQQSGSNRSFVDECEALRRARHRCLIKIITCCSSINHQGKEFKALVFEFMPNGSLNGWLHPEPRMPTIRNTLSLEQRLDIAVDIIDALDYLHNRCQPPIVHCDLKPSNILLAEDMSARVGDFGISRILPESASKALQNSNSTTYGEGSSVSTHGDVYSLGILLLEIFTGRSPTDVMFRGPLDLHEFSKNALPERIWDIADKTMWLHTDANDSVIRSRIDNCLVSVISLGISCSKRQPKERTLIHDAAIEMQAIRDSYF
ncbi:unnamed protein product [Urochloa decumbens]|uniref:Receptor kinase-like protein Xa21 n=1 Tax=Urochloa decumbens TaxID=240449 RepID=A0ABC8ZQY2_9POAL